MREQKENVLKNLQFYKQLSADPENHPLFLKNKKILLYIAILLDKDDFDIGSSCLDILENLLTANVEDLLTMKSLFGVYESLWCLSVRTRDVDERIWIRATNIIDKLQNTSIPPYRRYKSHDPFQIPKIPTIFLLQVDNLSMTNIHGFLDTLEKMNGIISFLVDAKMRRCIIRICPKQTIKNIIHSIFNTCHLKPLVVVENVQNGIETFFDLTTDRPMKSRKLIVTNKFLSNLQNSRPAGMLQKILNLCNRSFYW